jgi:hypothetical protein
MANRRVNTHRCDDKISPLQRNKGIRGSGRKIFITRGGTNKFKRKKKNYARNTSKKTHSRVLMKFGRGKNLQITSRIRWFGKLFKRYIVKGCIIKGPTIQQDLFSIITRFRRHKFVIMADTNKSCKVHPDERIPK